MTPTQITILLHIRRGINGHWDLRRAMGYEPTSGGNVSGNINRLKEQGFVTWEPNKARTLQLTEAGRAAVGGYVLLPGGGGIGRVLLPEREIELTLRWEPIQLELGA